MSTAVQPGRTRFAPYLTATVLTVLSLWLFAKAAEIFILLFLAILVSLYLQAVADVLHRRARVPKPVALPLAILLTLGFIVGLFWLLIPPVVSQTQQLVAKLPDYVNGWEQAIDNVAARFPAMQSYWKPGDHKLVGALYDQVSGLATDLVPKLFSMVHVAINVFAVAVMAIYLSTTPGTYREWIIVFFPPIHRDLVRDVLSELGTKLRAFIVGQILSMSILGALTAAGLYWLHVPYWLTFGLFTGVVSIIPFFGTLLSTSIPALFALAGPGWAGFSPGMHALFVVLWGVIVHLFEGNVLMPQITARQVEQPPVLTIMAVLVMGSLLGPLALLVAVPTVVVALIIVRRILVNRIYEGHGFRRTTRDRALVLRVPAPDGGVVLPEGSLPDLVGLAEADSEGPVTPLKVRTA